MKIRIHDSARLDGHGLRESAVSSPPRAQRNGSITLIHTTTISRRRRGGGMARSEAKVSAARANGRKGGRPRKKHEAGVVGRK